MAKGRNEHKIFELFYKEITIEDIDSAENVEKYFLNICANLIPKPINNYVEFAHMENFCRLEAIRWRALKDDRFFPVSTELKIHDDSWNMTCIIDRVDKVNGALGCIDYKTGSGSSLYGNAKSQLLINAQCFMNKYEKPIEWIGIYWVAKPIFIMDKVTKRKITYLKKDITKVRQGIEDDQFDAKPGWNCLWCGYWDECEENLTPEILFKR